MEEHNKRKQDLEDEMNRFEQEIAGNLPPPPKIVASLLHPSKIVASSSQGGPILRPPMGIRGMPFPGMPPMPPPPMFGQRPMHMQMDGMPSMPPLPSMPQMPQFDATRFDANSMPQMDGMPGMPPMPPGLPGLPSMMGMGPPMMGLVPPPPGVPGPSSMNTTTSTSTQQHQQPVKIDPPTVPLKNYDTSHIEEEKVEVKPVTEQNEAEAAASSNAGNDVGKESKQKKPKKKSVLRVAGGVVWEDETLLEWEVNDFRIFVGDLGNEVSDDALLRAFSAYPSLLKAKVVRDKKTKKTKGFGFVSFKDPKDYLRAMREMNGKYVGNRPIKLRKSCWKDRNINLARKKEKEKKKLGLR